LKILGEESSVISGISIEERLEEMAKRLERAEQANRAMKIWSSVAFAALIAFGSGPFASTVLAKKIKPPTAKVAAQEFDLETSTGTALAKLVPFEGGAELIFLDGSTTRTSVGFNTTNGGGLASFDSNGTLRSELGTDPTGTGHNGLAVYDANGSLRLGTTQSVANGNAFFLKDHDGTTLRGSLFSDDAGDSVSLNLLDATGVFRTGLVYDPTTHFFNGFTTQDGSGHPLSLLGNTLAASGMLAANDSFMSLSDTTGTLRVTEFQNSTNEGGISFAPGSTTHGPGWGNP